MTAERLTTDRLELVPLEPALDALVAGRRGEAEAALGLRLPDGWPDRHDARFLALRLRQLREDAARGEWLVWGLARRGGEELAGHAGYHGPPEGGAVEIGYTVFEPHRGRGLATEAARALIDRARGRGARRVIASVSPENAASLAVVRKLGFVQTGEQWDEEDGRELVFELAIEEDRPS